ncbi:MAG TPA: tRNA pseudouridine(55) synthase TruB [Lachnospiraceae bacterium]|nr:tRNA pseudouridine(55) synthase TruB [Lachnospiraceae bacterium]
MDGIINIYKESGFTSHDVVAKLRGILHQKKIGHTGTLDPAAEGVLPVCCGKAAKVCSFLTGEDKSYHAVCRLGVETDTQDMTGTILKRHSIKGITEEDITKCIKQFEGEIMQVPPMYSAIKVNGKRLYELAREGKTIDRKPRPVTISSIVITDTDLDSGTFAMDITCSKGTYIRTLCHDIGISLGTAAVMEKLIRTRVSVFKIEDSIKLSMVQQAAQKDIASLERYFISADRLFPGYKKFRIKDRFAACLANGNKLSSGMLCNLTGGSEPSDGENILVYDEHGIFKAIYKRETGEYRVNKMF